MLDARPWDQMSSINRDEAVNRAREAAEDQGLPWLEPVRTTRLFGRYYVIANWRSRGGAVHVTVRARDGTVLSVHAAPL